MNTLEQMAQYLATVIAELNTRIEALNARIAALEGNNNSEE